MTQCIYMQPQRCVNTMEVSGLYSMPLKPSMSENAIARLPPTFLLWGRIIIETVKTVLLRSTVPPQALTQVGERTLSSPQF